MQFLIGNSSDLLPAYVRAHPEMRIDILRTDGAKSNYYSDFISLRPLLHSESLVIFDHPNWPIARAAVSRAMAEGLLCPDRRFSQHETLFDQDAVMRLT